MELKDWKLRIVRWVDGDEYIRHNPETGESMPEYLWLSLVKERISK